MNKESKSVTIDPETPATPASENLPALAPEPPPPVPEEIELLKERAAKAGEFQDQYLRAAAALDNFKKRAVREKQDATKYANEALLQKLVPVLDNFEMALAAAGQQSGAGAQSLQTGVSMIYQQLRSVMTEAGLQEIDALNQPFDPNLHEAVSQQETAAAPEGHVVQQLRKGFKLRDRLLRPATVVVAKKPAA